MWDHCHFSRLTSCNLSVDVWIPDFSQLDGSALNGLNLRVAPRKEKPPEVAGETLLNLDMKKFRHEKHPRLLRDIDEFLQGFQCVGSFSQDKKESNTIIVPGCPPVLDWNKVINTV